MIKVKREGLLIEKTDELRNAINDFIVNYWGDLKNEKFFTIPYWQLKRMIDTSHSDTVTFRVYDINDKTRIDAEWVRTLKRYVDNKNEERSSSTNATEFFLTKDEFERLEAGAKKEYASSWQKSIFIARIGKEGDEFICLYNIGEFTLISGNIGGDGAAIGAKIPDTTLPG